MEPPLPLTPIPGDLRSCQWAHTAAEPRDRYHAQATDAFGVDNVRPYPEGAGRFEILGYPAVVGHGAGVDASNNCQVFVGVGPGQTVQMAYGYEGDAVPMTHELACEKAKRAATMMVRNILARSGG